MKLPTLSMMDWRADPARITAAANFLLLLAAVLVLVAYVGAALAGTDATFSAATTTITNWSTGSLGKLTAVAGVGAALVGMVLKFDWRLIAGAAGIGLTAATGPGIVSALVSATF